MHKRVVSFLLIAISGAASAAKDLVVDNVSGSDMHNDRGLVAGPVSYGPYRTITRALLAAGPGDRIILTKNDEPYRESVSLHGTRHSGTPTFPFEIIGNGATLDGTQAPERAWESLGHHVYRYQRPRHGFAQLLLGGSSLERMSGAGDLSQLSQQQWLHLNGYVYFRPRNGTTPLDHDLEITTEKVGITLYDVQHVTITDLTVRGYGLDGINAHDKANGIQLIGIAARHNGRSGISVGGSSSVTIGASLCELNGSAQLRTEGQSHTYLANVDLAPGTAVDIDQQDGEILKLPRN